ncbi:MAG: acyl--CoA ligase [Oligoflexia bacterium]|nr:acyl--CoA ligase [Oligoflexia bacterium]
MDFWENKSGIALRGEWGSLTYDELTQSVIKKTESLSTNKILTASNSVDFIVEFLAFWKMKVPVCIFSEGLSEKEKNQRLEVLKKPLRENTAVVVFTSGSTGAPKGVELSRENILANIEAVVESLEFSRTTQQGLFLSLSYSYGLFGQLLPALFVGIETVIYGKFLDLRNDFIEGKARGMYSGVPSHWEAILRLTDSKNCLNVTHVISAGAPLPLDLRNRLLSHFSGAVIYNNYGLTECSPRVLSLSSKSKKFLEEGSVGYPVKGLNVRVNAESILEVSGKQVMLGYVGDDNLTKEKIYEGWLRTGDLAKITEDQLVYILGREDDIFNIGGERVSPIEIEEALNHISQVDDVAIYVEEDALYGTKIKALLVLKQAIKKSELLACLKTKLSGHKIPQEYYQVEELPKTANGKLLRKKLKETLKNSKKIV